MAGRKACLQLTCPLPVSALTVCALQLCLAPGVPFTLDTSSSSNSQVVLSVPTKDLVAWLLGPSYAATCPLVPSVKELEALKPQAVLDAERTDMAPLQQKITHCINREASYVCKSKVRRALANKLAVAEAALSMLSRRCSLGVGSLVVLASTLHCLLCARVACCRTCLLRTWVPVSAPGARCRQPARRCSPPQQACPTQPCSCWTRQPQQAC